MQSLKNIHAWAQMKVALSWYGKLTWESAHVWNLIILCLLIVWGNGAFDFLCNSIANL